MTKPALCVCIAVSLALLSIETALAAPHPRIRGHDFLPEARWGKLKNRDVDKKYYVEGRWLEFYRPGISFYKHNEMRRFLVIPGTPDDPLYEQVVKGQDSLGNKLKKKRSMVRVFGIGQRQAGRIVLRVERVDKLLDEHLLFLQKLKEVEGDLDKLLELGRRCALRARLMDDKLLHDVAGKITQQELRARVAHVRPDDFQGLMRLAKRYETELNDLPAAIMIFGKIVEDRRAPASLKLDARRLLRARRAVRMRTESKDGKNQGRWVTYAEFKHSEGFVFRTAKSKALERWGHRDRWVRKEWAELEDARSAEIIKQKGRLTLVRNNPHQHASVAKVGRIERGQNFVEVSRAAGRPKLVNHWQGQLEGKNVVWSQWVMATGARIYFVRGEVISQKTAAEDWPHSEWLK